MNGIDLSFDVDQGFDAIGPADDPQAKLITAVWVNGIPHHLEFWAVVECPMYGQCVSHPDLGDAYDSLSEGFEKDGSWRTVPIEGRNYVLLMSPFCL